MKFTISLLVLTVLFNSCQGNSQDRISINIPTAASEADYIWRTIQDLPFFENNNYQLSLPKGSFIDDLILKSRNGSLTDEDYEGLTFFMRDSIYHKADYLKGYKKIENELSLINKMINELSQSGFSWPFKAFHIYQINLTLYGPGGSYDPDEGSILIFTTPDGQFKNYANPANTIIHEVVHIGIEESIVNKHKVPHPLKERIVDAFVSLNFSRYLPDYRIQDMGETRTDRYLKTKVDLKDLEKIVEKVLEGK